MIFFRLEVKVKGKPKPQGKWFKHGVEIIPSQEFQIEELEDGTSVLTIAETYPDDTGEIVFEAHNPLGVSTTTTYLSVEGKQFLKLRIIPLKLRSFHYIILFSLILMQTKVIFRSSPKNLQTQNEPHSFSFPLSIYIKH